VTELFWRGLSARAEATSGDPGENDDDRCWNHENIFSGSFLNEIKSVAF
jgi:hypothetical protein